LARSRNDGEEKYLWLGLVDFNFDCQSDDYPDKKAKMFRQKQNSMTLDMK